MILILDRGHGSLDSNCNYTTAPNKMHKFEDGTIAYEGYENSRYATALKKEAVRQGLEAVFTIDPTDARDMSLRERVTIANRLQLVEKNCIFMSIHNNASSSHNAEGSEIFTSKGETKSDKIAELILKEWKSSFPNRKMRYDRTDGDLDKEANFYVLRKTNMPAVLLEIGFFDNKKDFEWLSKQTTIDKLAKATIKGLLKYKK